MQGEEIRLHMDGIPRVSDPIPIIHVYVDLHLETLHAAGVIPASAPSSARSSRDNLYKVRHRIVPGLSFKEQPRSVILGDRSVLDLKHCILCPCVRYQEFQSPSAIGV